VLTLHNHLEQFGVLRTDWPQRSVPTPSILYSFAHPIHQAVRRRLKFNYGKCIQVSRISRTAQLHSSAHIGYSFAHWKPAFSSILFLLVPLELWCIFNRCLVSQHASLLVILFNRVFFPPVLDSYPLNPLHFRTSFPKNPPICSPLQESHYILAAKS